MIVVEYNNIRLENVITRGFRQEVVYDPSGTDHFFVRYTLEFEGLITGFRRGQYAACEMMGVPVIAHALWKDIRHALMDPRHVLEVKGAFKDGDQVNWLTLFRCVPERINPQDPDRDLGHGPKPIHLETLGSIGGRALKVRWQVQCEKLDFLKDLSYSERIHFEKEFADLQTVLDNRWSVEEELDSNFYLTRTIRGSLRLSRPVARIGFDYRWITVPALEAGFKRQRFRYTVKEDGLTCEYEVVDRQVHTAAPWPATEMRVTNSKSTELGMNYRGHCQVDLIGPPHVPRKALVVRAVQIMDALTKFLSRNLMNDKFLNWLPIRIQLTEHMGEVNQVTGSIEYQFSPGSNLTEAEQQFVNNYKELGNDLDLSAQPWPIPGLGAPPFPQYDPNLSWMPAPYGYNTWGGERDPAVVAIFQCYLQRPYHPWHATGWWPAPQGAPEEITRPAVEEVSVERVEPGDLIVPEEERKFSSSHQTAMYTYCRMVSTYKISRRRIVFDRLSADDEAAQTVVVQLGHSTARRVIVIDAERHGQHPELPAPVDYTDDNGVTGYLLDYSIDLLPPAVSPAGDGWIYRARARYVYALDRAPPEKSAVWPVGRLPHTAATDTGFKPEDVFTEDIGPNPSPSPS